MKKLDELLANRRIPGEVHHRRMDPTLQEELRATDPSLEEVSTEGVRRGGMGEGGGGRGRRGGEGRGRVVHHRRMDPTLQEELRATDPSLEEVSTDRGREDGREERGREGKGGGREEREERGCEWEWEENDSGQGTPTPRQC